MLGHHCCTRTTAARALDEEEDCDGDSMEDMTIIGAQGGSMEDGSLRHPPVTLIRLIPHSSWLHQRPSSRHRHSRLRCCCQQSL